MGKSEEIKCDECKKVFHNHCSSDETPSTDNIWTCSKCNSTDEICTNRDKFEIKAANSTPNAQLKSTPSVNLIRMDVPILQGGLRNVNEIKIFNMEQKITELERRLSKAEKKECKCSKKLESLTTRIEEIRALQQPVKTANEIESINKKIDSCEAMCEMNVTLNTEIQLQIIEINRRLNNCDPEKQTNSATQPHAVTNRAIAEMGNAIKRHNNTIKTHFKLSEAYNSDVMEKINHTLSEINKINDNRNFDDHSNQNSFSGKRSTNRRSNITASEIGKISTRPLHNGQPTCKQIRIHIYDSKCDSIGVAQKFIANILTMFSPTITEASINWFTTKIVFNQITHKIKRINLIADLPEKIDTNLLHNHINRVF